MKMVVVCIQPLGVQYEAMLCTLAAQTGVSGSWGRSKPQRLEVFTNHSISER
jgi:hypothetical protein